MTERYDAVVVGSGPNGLTAAATLAKRGKSVLVIEASSDIGGAVRSSDLGEPGWLHDTGATIHALAAISPAYRELDLSGAGVDFVNPEILLSHVLDGGGGASMHRSIAKTAEGLGRDERRYRSFIGYTASHFEALADDILGPVISLPRHPISLVRFGLRALLPMTLTAAMFKTEEARALVAGSAAHSFTPLHHPLTSAFALMLHGAGHSEGWPFAAGGSRIIAEALASIVVANGGEIVTGQAVEQRKDLPEHSVLLLDTTPSAAAGILGDDLPGRRARRFRRFRHGPGPSKSTSTCQGRSLAVRTSAAVRNRPRRRRLPRSARRRAGHVSWPHAGSTVRPRVPSVAVRPITCSSRQSHLLDLCPRPQRIRWRRTTADRRPDRTLRTWLWRRDPRVHLDQSCESGDTEPEPRRRRCRRRQLLRPADSPTANALAAPVPNRCVWGLHLLSFNTPGAGAHGMSGYLAAIDALGRELS